MFWTPQRHPNQILTHHTHLATMASKNKKDGESTTKNAKKRSLEEMQNNDDDSDDCDLQPPSNKKRKLNTAESTQTESKQDNDEDDDLKQKTNTSSKSKSASIEKADQFKICCFNLNGVRAAAKHGLEDYIQKGMQSQNLLCNCSLHKIYLEDADLVCFSEMKARKDQNPCTFRGYQVFWNECTEKAGYAGSAILSKTKPLSVVNGTSILFYYHRTAFF